MMNCTKKNDVAINGNNTISINGKNYTSDEVISNSELSSIVEDYFNLEGKIKCVRCGELLINNPDEESPMMLESDEDGIITIVHNLICTKCRGMYNIYQRLTPDTSNGDFEFLNCPFCGHNLILSGNFMFSEITGIDDLTDEEDTITESHICPNCGSSIDMCEIPERYFPIKAK